MPSADLRPASAARTPGSPSRRLTLFLGSATGADPAYRAAAAELATAIAGRGDELVYGGGRVGLMGVAADAALAAGGRVVGVIPTALADLELAHPGLTRLEVVADMSTRKARLVDLADAVVALPGGPGTLEEFFEAWTWQQLGLHQTPVAVYDVDGFWQPLLDLADHLTERGFMSAGFRESLIVARTPDGLYEALDRWHAPGPKWRD